VLLRRFLVPVLALPLLLPACGGGGDEPPRQALVDSIEATKAADSAHTKLHLDFDGGATLGTQAFDLAGDYATDGSAADITASSSGGSTARANDLKVRVDGTRAWVGGRTLASALPDGASWVSLTTKQLLDSGGYSNPGDLAFLYLLRGAEDVRRDGDTYRFTVDLDRAADRAPADLRDEVECTMSFSGVRDPEVTGTATLDDDGRVVAYRVQGKGGTIQLTLEAEFSDYGVAVDVDAPDGDDVVRLEDAPGVLRLLSGDGGESES
jgi:hypothetical protein